MSRQINQPINQVRLTNVAVVRCNKAGKRFEIACYRNKVMDYRAGLETDLSEVLQTERIFTNVSKGQFAKKADLEKAFGQSRDEEAIAKIILEEGSSLQVSDLERQQQQQNALSQIATWVAANCVHPDTGRPYTVTQIKHALGKNYTVQPHKAIKKQYLDAVKFLKTEIPIERAKMEVAIEYPPSDENDAILQGVLDRVAHRPVPEKSTQGDSSDVVVVVLQVDPSLYRELNELAKSVAGRLEILQQVVVQEGDVDLEREIERKKQQQQQASQESKAGGQTFVKGDTPNAVTDETMEPLVEKLEAVRLRAALAGNEQGGGDGSSDDDVDTPPQQLPVSRKSQRKAQKKSKKGKRREQEEAAERQAQVEEERRRQAQRFEKTQASEAVQANALAAEEKQVVGGATTTTTSARNCNTCGGSFSNAAEYRAHFRSDWHRFNQKLKLKNIPPVSEQEFLLCDAETFFGAVEPGN